MVGLKEGTIGILITVVGIVVILVYGWLIFFVQPLIVLQITAFVGVAAVLGIVIWIGITMARTPPPPKPEAEAAIPATI